LMDSHNPPTDQLHLSEKIDSRKTGGGECVNRGNLVWVRL
jgi:hypothetical protein